MLLKICVEIDQILLHLLQLVRGVRILFAARLLPQNLIKWMWRDFIGNIRRILFKQGTPRYDSSLFACKIHYVTIAVAPITFTINTVLGERFGI